MPAFLHCLHDVRADKLSQKGCHYRRRKRRPSRQLFRLDRRSPEGCGIRQAATALGKPIQIADPSLLQGFDEYHDGVTLQILSVFPTFVLQANSNAIAVRQIVPRAIDKN